MGKADHQAERGAGNVKNTFGNEYAYKRILEILNDYWITEPGEKHVKVDMLFEHSDGRTQHKCIEWWNKKLVPPESGIRTLSSGYDIETN